MVSTIQLLKERQARLAAMSPEEKAQAIRAAEAAQRAETVSGEPQPRVRGARFGKRVRVPHPASLSQGDLIVIALKHQPRAVTLSDLVICCWKLNSRVFGLAGHEEQYPCSSKVRAALFGARGLLAKGRVRKVGNLFEATGQP
jgi:hypothetical protein